MIVPRFAYVSAAAITERVVRNPNYGGASADVYGWRAIPITPLRRKPRFIEQLSISIANEGMRNPILVYSTARGVLLSFGGSRLRVARELDPEFSVPCIINDVNGSFVDSEQVTEDNWATFFTDVPTYHEFHEDGSFDYHYSLERNRRSEYDEAGIAWVSSETGSQTAAIDPEFLKIEFPWLVQRE